MATIIFKPTERCNSNCAYCDVVKKGPRQDMSAEMVDLLFSRINEYLVTHPRRHIVLTWHGGEPLLLGPEYFEMAFQLQAKRCAETKDRVTHLIQSNLTLFREEFVAPFRRLGIDQVGSSFEPIPNVRGPGKNRDSDRYNRKFFAAVSLLERHGLGWGIIYTVTRLSLPRPLDIFYFTTNLQPKRGVHFNYVNTPHRRPSELTLTPEEHADFLGAIFRAWWPRRERFPGVEPFASFVDVLLEGKPAKGCWNTGHCADTHLSVGSDGALSQCGRSLDWNIIDYGNLRDMSIDAVLQHPLRQRLRERDSVLAATACGDCRFWGLCHGLCPVDAMDEHGDFHHKSKWCAFYQIFLERYFEPITGVRYESKARTTDAHPILD